MGNEDVGDAEVGHRLAQLREQVGLKQAELARKVTWSPAVLSRVETGDRAVSDDELSMLLAAIGTDEATELAAVLARNWQHLPRPPLDHPDQQLLWRAEEMVAGLITAGSEADAHPAFLARLQEYVKDVERLAQLLLRREHQIAFIGSIGIGKSTAICRSTGLEVTNAQGRTVSVLETGAGGITLCEVRLSRGPGYGIKVEPRPLDEIRSDVDDFVDQIRQGKAPAEEDDITAAVPRELERAIRNMAGLTQKRSKGPDGKSVRTDPAKELAAEFPERRDLAVEVLARMNLHRRDRRDAWHTASASATPLEWLRQTFEAINNGRHPEFPLPSRIDIVVPALIDIDDLDVGIIDTRGIDQPPARADLETLLEDPHTVSILCSGFNDAPSQSVQHLLKRARDIDNPQIDTNAGLLILARPDEAMAVKDETGVGVSTSEEGYELKGEQVSTALLPYGLGDVPALFFNSREDDAEQLRDFLRDQVRRTRAEFRHQLDEVLVRTQSLLDNAALEQVRAVQRDAGKHMASWIKLHPSPKPLSGHIHDALLDEISRAHSSTVNATIRRNGEWRSLSYSHQLGHGARRLAVLALQDSVTEFTGMCETLSASMPDARELLFQANRLMISAYEDLLRKMQLNGLSLYRDQLRTAAQFWIDNASEWGRGSGYVNRVLQRNRTWFEETSRQELEQQLGAFLDREWRVLLQRVEAIFEQS
ncbi:helix-turn-helix domain-containing protein [Micromonospora sp. NBC_01796]|uniref:helix-turn-helix domain-containing protein n=1 Tax=Micromonospora sp. NBC_01796 TaxID=2975987 RepID=UPI002DD9EA5F|nr:helix-turn-helix transcriptional regulator [Micromonospora sp. NBC_01796]WSA83876.1 helix-turn-helix domain-containing protein [Micromonospora sp. NBC_01796]